MLILVTAIFISLFQTGSPEGQTNGPTVPFPLPTTPFDLYTQNLTVVDMTPRSISLRWSCRHHHHDKYELTLKPLKATYRVVETVPMNSCYQNIENLLPDTGYQIYITLFNRSLRRRSNILTIKTPMEEPEVELDEVVEEEPSRELKMPHVKFVELSLVGLALILWIVAIALFFHRWGKIRMLLPYQPAYKESPTGASCTNCVIPPHHQCSRIPIHECHGPLSGGVCSLGPLGLVPVVPHTDAGCSPMRPRLNSFIASYGNTPPADMKIRPDLRIYRKVKSAECLSPTKYEEIEFIDF